MLNHIHVFKNINLLLKISSSGRQEIEVTNIVTQLCPTLCVGLQPTRLLCPWDFPDYSTGVDCHFLLQRIFLTQGWYPGLPHCRQRLYRLSHQGSPTNIYIHLITTGIQMKMLARRKIAFWKMKLHMICFLLMLIKRPFLYLSIISKTKETL